ncbi:MAG: MFS transporter [Erysipelotrichaceae bacterium]|jgi:probable glucitol transport protein GutA|nr:MFS transporter [Erysipelotrichaceae bacterium]
MNKKLVYQTSLAERLLFGCYGTGLSIYFVLVGTYLNQYCLTEAAIPAEILALVFLIAKIWDGINDPIFGVIVDRVRLKSGKFLPWMRIATLALPFTASLMFFVPSGIPGWLKGVYIMVTYMLYDSASTLTEVPYFAITTAMSDNPEERSQIISTSKIVALVPAFLVVFIPWMYQHLGWQVTIILFALLSMASMLPGCFLLKERYTPVSEQPPKLRDFWTYLKGNKYLLIYFFSAVVYGITNTSGNMGNLFAIYNLGDESMINALLFAGFIPWIVAMVFVKQVIGKIDKITLLLMAQAITIAVSVFLLFAGYANVILVIVCTIIRGFSMGLHTTLFFLFAPDFAEYGTYKSGIHAEGTAFSIQSLASKLINALASAFGLMFLAAFQFQEGSTVQSAQALQGIWYLVSIMPAIGAVLQSLILIFFYKLTDKDVQIMSQVNHNEISREEGERLLAGRNL